MGTMISKNNGVVITVPAATWNAIYSQASRLYMRMHEDRITYPEDVYEKVGFATDASENMMNLLDGVKTR